MQRTNPNYRYEALSADEVDAFLDDLLNDLLDSDDLTSESDKIPDLGRLES